MRSFDEIAEVWRRQSPTRNLAGRASQVENACRLAVAQRERDPARNLTYGLGLLLLTLALFGVAGMATLTARPTPSARLCFVGLQIARATLLLHFTGRFLVSRRMAQNSGADLRRSIEAAQDATAATLLDLRAAAWIDSWLFVLIPLVWIGKRSGAVAAAVPLFWAAALALSHVAIWGIAWRCYDAPLRRRRRHLRSLLGDLGMEIA